jgi:hypothetical protein
MADFPSALRRSDSDRIASMAVAIDVGFVCCEVAALVE